jgi:hypothetical protein
VLVVPAGLVLEEVLAAGVADEPPQAASATASRTPASPAAPFAAR